MSTSEDTLRRLYVTASQQVDALQAENESLQAERDALLVTDPYRSLAELRDENERLRALLDPDNEKNLDRLHRIVYDLLVEWQVSSVMSGPPAQKIVDRLLAALRREAIDE